ncbi:LysR substrate-binding domain-containing protein [Catenovulum sp. 2E275]|uniref:hydrogen peroxide-inducible genes activator n=1 Tax=Catenovulum sp. 2E275 TaxID=2980497 RepID=UPI0021CED0AB|nr:hydrogen peroxide-inducible genes activator [Catenovulum sp. 2E275]MCU4674480.1 LysR substrate-binding domain-containing protein [Catenovulum sp. 2E275]
MDKLPSLRNLQYLIKLHELKSFNKAAEACFVSQSTLSSGIQNLEDQLEGQLIERDHKSFVFTQLGEELVDMAKSIVQQASELKACATARQSPMSGLIKLGCIPTIAPFLFKPVFAACREEYPELRLQLIEDTTENLLTLLESGEIDCALMALPVDINGFHSKFLGQDKFWLAAHKQYQQANQDNFSYDNLPDESIFLLQSEHCLTQHAVSACQLVNRAKISTMSATSLHTLVSMAECLKGATFVPQMALSAGLLEESDLVLLQPTAEAASRDIALVWRQTTRRAKTFSLFSALITEQLNTK